jgi:Tol biopolymer transport system component
MIAFQSVTSIATVRVDGSDLRHYVFGPMTFDPDWSPDGRHLLFSMYQGSLGDSLSALGSRKRIYAVSREDSSVHQVIPDAYGVRLPNYWDHDAVWSRARNQP